MQKIQDGQSNQARTSQLRQALSLATKARDETAELDLEFETYLLEMAVVALTEKLEAISDSDAQ